MDIIRSSANEHFKALHKYHEHTRMLKKASLAWVEGIHMLEEVLAWEHAKIIHLVLPESALDDAPLKGLCLHALQQSQGRLTLLSDSLFKQLSELESGRGPIVLFEIPEARPMPTAACDVLILAGVQDPGNVGTLLRTAAAAGIAEVWFDEKTAWPWAPKVLRAGMGGHRLCTVRPMGPDDLPKWFDGLQSFATTLDATGTLYESHLKKPVAWILGSEGQGVSPAWQARCTHPIRIPQPGGVESLNVAIAGAVCMFEMVRQRLSA